MTRHEETKRLRAVHAELLAAARDVLGTAGLPADAEAEARAADAWVRLMLAVEAATGEPV